MGDYDQMAADASGFYIVWGDNRNAHLPYHANQPDVMLAKTAACAAPAIGAATASPSVLWPPDHKMRDVTVDYFVTGSCLSTCKLYVTSDEPPNAHEADYAILDDHHLQLRSERDGNGDGRTYSITISCTSGGGSATRTAIVTVPHDMGR